jgi:Fe-S-cluster-containing hydrogenase component 2
MKRYTVTPSRCTACRSCELACSFRHAEGGKPGPTRIRAYMFTEGHHVPLTCMQCEEAACMTVCPVGALVRNTVTGAIDVHNGKCIGCQACVAACPFGAMAMHGKRPLAYKCDLCGGEPACVQFCPTKALEYLGT